MSGEGRPLVLVVEDEQAVRRLVVAMLDLSGYEALEAGSATEALGHLERDTRPVEVILTDLSLPDMHGRELVDRVRVLRPGIKVLLTSGAPDASIGDVAETLPFIQKPFTRHALVERLAAL